MFYLERFSELVFVNLHLIKSFNFFKFYTMYFTQLFNIYNTNENDTSLFEVVAVFELSNKWLSRS